MYVQSDTLLLADIFEIYVYMCMCLEIYQLDSSRFLTALGVAWQEASNKAKVKLDLLTNIVKYKLLMVEKGIRGGICHSNHQYVKPNNKYMKDYVKNK